MTEVNQKQGGGVLVPTIATASAATAGYFAADKANFGIKSQALSSWEDAVADTTRKDGFFKEMAKKAEGETKTALETLDTNLTAYRTAEKDLTALLKEGADTEVLNALTTADDAARAADDALFAKIKADPTKVGLAKDAGDDVIKNEVSKLKGLADDAVDGLDDIVKAEVKAAKAAQTAVTTAETNIRGKASELAKDASTKIDDIIAKQRTLASKYKEGAKNVGDDILQKVKCAGKWTNALVFGLGGLILGFGINALVKKNKS